MDGDQTEAVVLAFDDGGAAKPLVTERDEAWVNVNAGAPRWLPDGSGLLWMSEAKGDWVLQVRAPDGTLVRELNTPEFGLRSVVGFDGAYVVHLSEPLMS